VNPVAILPDFPTNDAAVANSIRAIPCAAYILTGLRLPTTTSLKSTPDAIPQDCTANALFARFTVVIAVHRTGAAAVLGG
jgi:hypothetical protein